jgi:hypothetical protein
MGTPSLTDSEKDRIRHEEIFRQEVRASLENRTPFGNRVWAFLNSNFGIWALSSLVLAFLGWQFTSWKEKSSRLEADMILTWKLHVELNNRSEVFIQGLDDFRNRLRQVGAKDESQPQFAARLNELFKDFDTPETTVYPEFRSAGVLSLLRLSREVHERNNQLDPIGSMSRNNFLAAEHEYREMRRALRKATEDPRPSELLTAANKLATPLTKGGMGQVAWGPPEPWDEEPKPPK